MTLAVTWAELEAQPGGSGRVVTRVYPESSFDLHIGVDLDTRRRQLIFKRRWKQTDVLPEFPVTQAIVCNAQVEPGGVAITLVVELLDAALSDIFTPVVEDLADRIVTAPDENAATRHLADGLARWQELFEELTATGLGTLVRRGLVGELLVLSRELLGLLPPEAAIAAWTGPAKTNQDFQRPAVAVEVKVTTGKQPQGFVVANERELDPTGARNLVVAHISLDERRGGSGSTLNDLVDDVERMIVGHPVASSAFADKLARVGYLHVHRAVYDEPHYEVRGMGWFEVRDDFPRIVEGDLRSGVGDVRYTVDLAACQPFAMDVATCRALLAAGGGPT